jgi:hypothetical protein
LWKIFFEALNFIDGAVVDGEDAQHEIGRFAGQERCRHDLAEFFSKLFSVTDCGMKDETAMYPFSDA